MIIRVNVVLKIQQDGCIVVVTTAQVVETSVLGSPEDHTQSTYDMFTII